MADVPDGEYSFVHQTFVGPYRYEGRYRDGKRDGLWRVTKDDTGELQWETGWSGGVWHGRSASWWSNGNKMQDGERHDGHDHGLWRFWFEDGTLAAEGHYERGRKVGTWSYWTENGSPMPYSEWEVEYDHWDWAYDDTTWLPRGANWPEPPPPEGPLGATEQQQ